MPNRLPYHQRRLIARGLVEEVKSPVVVSVDEDVKEYDIE